MKSMRTLMFAGLAAAGLALAGCGSDGGPSQADLDAERDRTEQQMMMVTQLQNQINALRTQLGLPEDGNLGTSIQGLQDEVDRLQGEIDRMAEAERMAEEEAARMAAAKTGKDLHAALGPPAAADMTALDNATVSLATTGLTITPVAGAGAIPDAGTPPPETLTAGDSAGALGSWNGMNYAATDAGTKVSYEAVVYNNRGPGKSESFKDAGYTVATADDDTATPEAIKGYVAVVSAGTVQTDFDITDVMADAFTHAGTQNHATSTDNPFRTRGTYDGAPGWYRCESGCSSTNDGKGSPTSLGGTWHFQPDSGAMVHRPDTAYLYYGWWVSKDKDGMPTAASAFVDEIGDVEGTGTLTDPATITGSAIYAGHAAGKFALDYTKDKLIDGTSDGGHFTADVTLTAKFGSGSTTPAAADAGVSGTIDNFMANGESVPWSVALHRAPWDTTTAGAFATPATDDEATTNVDESMGTTWSIDGASAPRSGTWSGQMHDEALAPAAASDGSNVPTTAVGTFYSTFDVVGRMVGAFGANKQ